MNKKPDAQHFPALLRFWRNARGLSQIDLAAATEISPKHLSFLETGRAQPSQEIILRLSVPLDLPLREQNTLLQSAGFEAHYRAQAESSAPPEIQRALSWMKEHHAPFPLVVLDAHYNLIDSNLPARALVALLFEGCPPKERNTLHWLFHPGLLRPKVNNWSEVAHALLVRLQREQLARRRDGQLRDLLSELCSYPDVPQGWRTPDWTQPTAPTLTMELQVGQQELSFLTTLTVFQSPQDVSLDELRIESYFPQNEESEKFCHQHLRRTGRLKRVELSSDPN